MNAKLLIAAGAAAYLYFRGRNKQEQEYIAPTSLPEDIDVEEAGADNNSEAGGQIPTSLNDSANPTLPTDPQEPKYDASVFEQVDVAVSAENGIASQAIAKFSDFAAGAISICQVDIAMTFLRTAGTAVDVTNISATFGRRYLKFNKIAKTKEMVKKPINSWTFNDIILDIDQKSIQFQTRFNPSDYGMTGGWVNHEYYIDLCYKFDGKDYIDEFYFKPYLNE